MFRGKFASRAHDVAAKLDFEQAKQIQRHQGHQHGQADKKLGVTKLHAPAGAVAGGFNANDQAGQDEKRDKHAHGIDKPQIPHAPGVILGLPHKAEDFQRDHRQHAGHHIQDQTAQEGVKQYFPERQHRDHGGRCCHGSRGSYGGGRSRCHAQFHLISLAIRPGFLNQQAGNFPGPVRGGLFNHLADLHFARAGGHGLGGGLNFKIIASVRIKIRLSGSGGGLPLDGKRADIPAGGLLPPGHGLDEVSSGRNIFLPGGQVGGSRGGPGFCTNV